MRIYRTLLALGAATLLAACTIPFGPWSGAATGTADAAAPGPGYAALQDVDWTVDDPAFIDPRGGRTPTLRFLDGGQVSGSGGCNRFTGPATVSGAGVRIGPLASTRMACLEDAMAVESRFFAALDSVRASRIDGNHLLLLDEVGTPMLRLARAPAASAEPGKGARSSNGAAPTRAAGAPAAGMPAGPGLVERALARGVRFLGRGNEPGWRIEIGPGDAVRVVYGYGTVRVDFPSLPGRRGAAGETIHEGSAGGHSVRITLRELRCTDDMSGELFPVTVLLRFDGEERRGCGAPLAR